MVAAIKIRIKFGSQGSVKTFQTFPSINSGGDAKKFEHSVGEDLFNSADQSKKRRRKEQDGFQEKKKQKLDSEMSSQCLKLLNLLMEDRAGWLFNTPVDPVKLEIPDYFSVISKPMDLGTVKSKLLMNEYNNADEFAADVRLTFTNSMLYNPPGNMIHEVAKNIKEVFEVRWKFLNKSHHETSDSSGRFSVELTKPVKEKSEKVSLSSKPVNGQSKTDTPTVTPKASARKSINKELDQSRGVSSTAKVPKKACECGSCGGMICICLKSSNSIGSVACSLMDSQVKNTSGSGSQASKLDPNCNGSVSSRNEYHELETPTPALPPLPPEKAVRAAILKCKYAEAILKAKQKLVPNQSNKADQLGLQIEKEKMEKTQREEIARIEAEIRAAKIASRKKAQAELKQKRETQRLEIEKMKKDFDFERHNHQMVEKDFVSVCGCSTLKRTWMLKLGLVLRNDECPELEEIGSETSDAIRDEDLEEGELI